METTNAVNTYRYADCHIAQLYSTLLYSTLSVSEVATAAVATEAMRTRILFLLPFVLSSVISLFSSADALVPAALVHTCVGAIAGSAGAFAVYPIDYVKSQLQTEAGRAKWKSGGVEAAVDICRTSGPLAFYRGVLINLVGVSLEKTVKLSANTFFRVAIRNQCGALSLLGEIIAGGLAGMTQVVVTNPLEVVKVKLQTSDMSLQDVMVQIQGIKDLYQGAGACVARDMIFSAVLFPVYAHAKIALALAIATDESPAFVADIIAGSFAAAPAAILATPADVIKTRIQAQSKNQNSPKENISFLSKASNVIQEEGPAVLFSGCLERVVRSVPQFGVTLALFDVLNTAAIEHGWLLPESLA